MLKRILIIIGLVLMPLVASAQATPVLRLRYRTSDGSNYLLNNVASTASAPNRTILLGIGGYAKATIQANITWVQATAITMTCLASTDQGATFAAITDQTITSGTGTLLKHTWSYAVSSNDGVIIDVGTGTYDYLQCTFAAPGGAAGDTLKVSAIAGAP